MNTKYEKFIIIMYVLSSIFFQSCTKEAKERDSIVLEWRAKFYEVASAAENYRRSDKNMERIFPERVSDLHQWSELYKNKFLTNEDAWIEFDNTTELVYKTYDEMSFDEINDEASIVGETEVLRKSIVGNDGRSYKISLFLNGIVGIKCQN